MLKSRQDLPLAEVVENVLKKATDMVAFFMPN